MQRKEGEGHEADLPRPREPQTHEFGKASMGQHWGRGLTIFP